MQPCGPPVQQQLIINTTITIVKVVNCLNYKHRSAQRIECKIAKSLS